MSQGVVSDENTDANFRQSRVRPANDDEVKAADTASRVAPGSKRRASAEDVPADRPKRNKQQQGLIIVFYLLFCWY